MLFLYLYSVYIDFSQKLNSRHELGLKTNFPLGSCFTIQFEEILFVTISNCLASYIAGISFGLSPTSLYETSFSGQIKISNTTYSLSTVSQELVSWYCLVCSL